MSARNDYYPVDRRRSIFDDFDDNPSTNVVIDLTKNFWCRDERLPLVYDDYLLEYHRGEGTRKARDIYNGSYLMLQTITVKSRFGLAGWGMAARRGGAAGVPPQPHRPAAPPCPTVPDQICF